MEDKNRRGIPPISWGTCLRLVVSVLVVYLLVRHWGEIESFVGAFIGGVFAIIAGLIVAYILNIPMRFFEHVLPGPTGDGTRNRGLALLLAIVCAVGILAFVGGMVIPNLVNAIIKLAQAIPSAVERLTSNQFLSSLLPPEMVKQLETINWNQVIDDATKWLQSGVSSSLPQVVNIFSQLGAWLMGVLFATWFLGEKNELSNGAHKLVRTYIGQRADERLSRIIAISDGSFRSYIVGSGLEGLIFGGLVFAACTIAGMDEALMLGALVGVLSLIPVVGAVFGAILGAIIILATSWQQALIFLAVFFVVQQIEQIFIYPNVVAKSVGLTGLWPLVGITIGMAMFGFLGALVGVPLTATVFRIIDADFDRRENLSGDQPNQAEESPATLHE